MTPPAATSARRAPDPSAAAKGTSGDTEQLARLAAEFSLPLVALHDLTPDDATLASVPRALAERHRVFPVERRGRVLRVALADPLATDAIDALAHGLGLVVEPCLAAAAEIDRAIARHYRGERIDSPAESPAAVPGTAPETNDAPVVRLAERIVADALAARASDIHLEPGARELRLRFRIDGVLHEAGRFPRNLQLPLVARFKLLAGLSLAEKRLPQDGRMRHAGAGGAADLRVSSLPSVHGETLVLRLLDARELRPSLDALGMAADDRARLERIIRRPDGLVLVTGPTGSGKTTTLYSCLQQLNTAERKILTIEDPVEYRLAGVNQVAVHEEAGLTFASALRAMLRQSPDVVMIGEVRDRETAEIAVNAALTGHLVFSTLHTNDAPGAVVRLLDLGVKPFLVAAALRAVVAQRLVRRTCADCGRAEAPTAEEAAWLGAAARETLVRGRGCAACRGLGFRGRVGLFELLETGAELPPLIHARAPAAELRAAAGRHGWRTMRADGRAKIAAGLTTVDEVAAATAEDAD